MRKLISLMILWLFLLANLGLFIRNFQLITRSYEAIIVESALIVVIPGLFYLIVLSRFMSFYEIFLHEFTHLLFSLFFLEKAELFHVSKTYGEMTTSSSFRNIISAASPYFFPVVTILLILAWTEGIDENLRYVIPASYGIFWAVIAKQIWKNYREIISLKWYGIIFTLLMNFWISFYVMAWHSNNLDLFNESIKTVKSWNN